MILKSSFFRLQKEDMKHRIWFIALISITILLILPISCALQIDNYLYEGYSLDTIMHFIDNLYGMLFAITIACAFISGLSGFFYLHSRKKLDLYHSIPVRRETLFAVNYVNGILIFIVPYIVNLAICLIVFQLKGCLFEEVLKRGLIALATDLLFYCLIYTVTIIAVILTGNIIISCLGAAVFMLYGPLLLALKEMYYQGFFKTYYTPESISDKYYLLSPLFAYYGVMMKRSNEEKYTYLILGATVIFVICLVLAVFLYKKRPSEAAGNAMAFGITKPIIKFLLVVPMSLAGGIVLRSIAASDYDGWFFFGLLFVLVIGYAIIQVIYNFDIRCAFKQKKQLLACFIITIAIAGIFRFDLLRVDSYLPDRDDVKYMSVYISGIDEQLMACEKSKWGMNYINEERYQLHNMTMTDCSAAYDLAKLGISSSKGADQKTYNAYDEGSYNYTVKYKLKNNKTVYRRYKLMADESKELLKTVFENEEFRKAHYPLNKIDVEDINEISVSYALDVLNYMANGKTYGNGNITISNKTNGKEIRELIDTYRKELNKLTFEEASGTCPIAMLSLSNDDYTLDSYYVYPSFTNTIAMLNRFGFDTNKTIDVADIRSISINNYTGKGETVNMPTYTDKESITEMLPLLIDQRLYYNNRTLYRAEKGIEANLELVAGEEKSQQYFNYYFKAGKVPEYVKNDLRLPKE